MLWGINRYVNNSALRASSSNALVLLPDMLTIRHYVPHPRSIFECIIQSQNTNTISALRASNLALIEELIRKLRHYVPGSGIALTSALQMTTHD